MSQSKNKLIKKLKKIYLICKVFFSYEIITSFKNLFGKKNYLTN